MKVIFFKTPSELSKWFESHHASTGELWVGYYKVSSGKPSITWQESVEEAICFGWIDGIRKSIDDVSYMIRFTPRKPGSIWSSVNIKKAQELVENGRMQPTGLAAFQSRKEDKSRVYSYEQRSINLEEPYRSVLQGNQEAWDFFQSQAPYYRRAVGWWIITAKKEETRYRRLEKLIEYSARRQTLPELTPRKPAH